jgi:hypothetical protein
MHAADFGMKKRSWGCHLEKGRVSFWCFTEGIVNLESNNGMRSIERKTHHFEAEQMSLQRDLDNSGTTSNNDPDSDQLDEQWGVPAPPDFLPFLQANQGKPSC